MRCCLVPHPSVAWTNRCRRHTPHRRTRRTCRKRATPRQPAFGSGTRRARGSIARECAPVEVVVVAVIIVIVVRVRRRVARHALSVGVQQLSCSTLSTLGAAPTTDPRQSHRVHSLPLLHRRHLRPCRAVHRQGRRTGTTVLSSPGGGTPEGAGPTCTPNCAPASPTRLALPRCVDGAISPTLLAIGQGARSAGAAAGGGGRATGAAAHGAGAQPRQRRAVEGGSLGAVSPWGRLTAAHRGANDPLR